MVSKICVPVQKSIDNHSELLIVCRASYVTPTSIFNSIRAVHPMFRGYLQHVRVAVVASKAMLC